MDGEVFSNLVIGIQEEVSIQLRIALTRFIHGTIFCRGALIGRIGTRVELPHVIEVFLGEVGNIGTTAGNKLQAFDDLETKFNVSINAVIGIGGIVVVKRPPGILRIGGIEVVGIVQHAVPVADIGIVNVDRILKNVLIDGGTASALTGHGIANVFTNVVDAIVEPGKTFLDTRVAAEGEIVTLVVVVASGKDTIGIDITIRRHKSGGLAAALDGNGVVGLKAGGIEVIQGLILIGITGMVFGVVINIGIVARVVALFCCTRTPNNITAIQEVTPRTILGGRIVVKNITVIRIEPTLAKAILDIGNSQNRANLEGTVVRYFHLFVLGAAFGGDDNGTITGA